MKYILACFTVIALCLVACSKQPSAPTNTFSVDGMSKTNAHVGDTVIITGNGFTSNCIIRVGSNQVTAFTISDKSISFIVPAGITSGTVTVVLNGTSVDAGVLTLTAKALYALRSSSSLTQQSVELVLLNTVNGQVQDSINLDKYYLYQNNYTNGVYYGPTNELLLLYASDAYNGITKINLATKQVTNVVIKGNSSTSFSPLVVINNNIYTVRYYYNQPTPAEVLRIDVATGETAAVAAFDKSYSPVYNFVSAAAQLNSIVGLFANDTSEYWLTANIATGKVTSTALPPSYNNATRPTNGLAFAAMGDSLYQFGEDDFPEETYITTRLRVINPLNGQVSSYTSLGAIYISENLRFFTPVDGPGIIGINNQHIWHADLVGNIVTSASLYANPAWADYNYYCFIYF